MNIVFWSNNQGKCGTTSNLMAIATLTSIVYDLKTIVLNVSKSENIWSNNFSTDHSVNMGKENLFKEDFAYYNSYGVDNIIDELRIRSDINDIVKENMVRVRKTGIYYIPPSSRNETGLYTKEMENVIPEIMRTAETLSDLTFIDVKNGRGKLTDIILECADIVVVNLTDENGVPQNYISEKLQKKCVYIVGRNNSENDKIKLVVAGKYKKKPDEVSIISERKQWEKAISEGHIIDFLTEGIHLRKDEEDFDFVKELFDAMNMVLRKAGYDV